MRKSCRPIKDIKKETKIKQDMQMRAKKKKSKHLPTSWPNVRILKITYTNK